MGTALNSCKALLLDLLSVADKLPLDNGANKNT